jgi:uncharacterized protein
MRLFRLAVIVLSIFSSMPGVSAQPSPASHPGFPMVTIPSSVIRSLTSKQTGRNYDLYIHFPSSYGKETARKYPVLYILDG